MHDYTRGRTLAAPHLITRPSWEAELHAPAAGLEGHFTVELVHGATGLVKRRLEFRNLITDAGLNYIGTNPIGNLIGFLAVGTGTTAPAVTDVSLEAQIGGRTASDGGFAESWGTNSSASPPYQYIRRTRVFLEAEANGNLTELGFFSATTGGTMFNRQLFKDANGVPTTITKTNTDQLRVTFEWRAVAPSADVTGTISLSGAETTHTFTARPQRNLQGGHWAKGTANGWSVVEHLGYWTTGNNMEIHNATALVAPTASMYGTTYASATTASLAAYTSGSHARESTYTFEPNRGNFPVTGLTFGYAGNSHMLFQAIVSPAIPKTDTKRLVLGMRMSWGRT